jgi:hypothetical protein
MSEISQNLHEVDWPILCIHGENDVDTDITRVEEFLRGTCKHSI